MKLRVYHDGKPEERRQLAEAINEITIGIRMNWDAFNGTTCSSMHVVCWWAFKVCVVLTLKTGHFCKHVE
jgi:hypothetical protein